MKIIDFYKNLGLDKFSEKEKEDIIWGLLSALDGSPNAISPEHIHEWKTDDIVSWMKSYLKWREEDLSKSQEAVKEWWKVASSHEELLYLRSFIKEIKNKIDKYDVDCYNMKGDIKIHITDSDGKEHVEDGNFLYYIKEAILLEEDLKELKC
jgi:hypothetical protein